MPSPKRLERLPAKVLDNGSSRVAMMAQWFDTSAYCIPGAAGCPGFRNVDALAFRNFKVYERLNFQIRGEFTNVFNLTNLGTPTTAMNSANFGKITGSGGPNRIIQVGGRIFFETNHRRHSFTTVILAEPESL